MFYEKPKLLSEHNAPSRRSEGRANGARRERFSIRTERPKYPEARAFQIPAAAHRRSRSLSVGPIEQWAGKEPNAGALIMNAIFMLVVVVGGVLALGSLGAAMLPLAIEKLGALGVVVTGFALLILASFILSTFGKLLRKHATLLD